MYFQDFIKNYCLPERCSPVNLCSYIPELISLETSHSSQSGHWLCFNINLPATSNLVTCEYVIYECQKLTQDFFIYLKGKITLILDGPMLPVVKYLTHWTTCFPSFCVLYMYMSRRIIHFIEDKDANPWDGYLYALSLFIVSLCHSLLTHNMVFIQFTNNIRVRNAMMSAIYHKVGKLIICL